MFCGPVTLFYLTIFVILSYILCSQLLITFYKLLPFLLYVVLTLFSTLYISRLTKQESGISILNLFFLGRYSLCWSHRKISPFQKYLVLFSYGMHYDSISSVVTSLRLVSKYVQRLPFLIFFLHIFHSIVSCLRLTSLVCSFQR